MLCWFSGAYHGVICQIGLSACQRLDGSCLSLSAFLDATFQNHKCSCQTAICLRLASLDISASLDRFLFVNLVGIKDSVNVVFIRALFWSCCCCCFVLLFMFGLFFIGVSNPSGQRTSFSNSLDQKISNCSGA